MTEPSITIEGVPASIKRDDYIAMIRSIGLDPNRLKHLEFGLKGAIATVMARTPKGSDYLDPIEDNTIATHRITIRIVD